MSQTQDTPENGDDKKDLVDSDPYLHTISYYANNIPLGFMVSVHAGGTIITGTVISRAEYNREMREVLDRAIRKAGLDEEGQSTWDLMIGNIFDKDVPEPGSEEGEDIKVPYEEIGYLHLKKARVSFGNQLIPTQGPGIYWRGRLDRIDGFWMGNIEQGP